MLTNEHPIPQEGQRSPETSTELERLSSLWAAVYGGQPGYMALFSGVRRERGLSRTQAAFYPWPQTVEKAVSWVRWQASEGKEVYHCGHLLTQPRRRKEAAAPLASLYADVDQAEIFPAVPEPSVLVESSPGKLQAYWRLTEPIDPARGEDLNRRLAYTLGADPSGWDLTQLLRVPGSRNHKYGGAPLVRALHVTAARYDPEALARLLVAGSPRSALPSRPTREAHVVAAAVEPPVQLSRPALAVWNGEDVKLTPDGLVDRSASLLRLARVLAEAGVRGARLAAALAERDEALGWQKYSTRRDALEQYQRLADLVEYGTRTKRRASQ